MIDERLAKSIKLLALDVDGVMTDGGVYLGDSAGSRVELKRYDIQDGVGLAILKETSIRQAIITGRVSESVRLRAIELGIEDVAQDPDGHKLAGFNRILRDRGISAEEVAFIGDDFPDLPIMRIVGLPVSVANAVPEIVVAARHRLKTSGGRGAIREFIQDLLKARGEWDAAWNRYVDARSVARPKELA